MNIHSVQLAIKCDLLRALFAYANLFDTFSSFISKFALDEIVYDWIHQASPPPPQRNCNYSTQRQLEVYVFAIVIVYLRLSDQKKRIKFCSQIFLPRVARFFLFNFFHDRRFRNGIIIRHKCLSFFNVNQPIE